MANQKTKKCAHIACLCDLANGEDYCGQACRDAGSDNVEIACHSHFGSSRLETPLAWPNTDSHKSAEPRIVRGPANEEN
jgi:hypothetical protein